MRFVGDKTMCGPDGTCNQGVGDRVMVLSKFMMKEWREEDGNLSPPSRRQEKALNDQSPPSIKRASKTTWLTCKYSPLLSRSRCVLLLRFPCYRMTSLYQLGKASLRKRHQPPKSLPNTYGLFLTPARGSQSQGTTVALPNSDSTRSVISALALLRSTFRSSQMRLL